MLEMIDVNAEPRGETLVGEGIFVGRKCLPMSSTCTSSSRLPYSYIIFFFEPLLGIELYYSEYLSTAYSIPCDLKKPFALRLNLLAEKPKLAPPICRCLETTLFSNYQ